MHKIAIQGYAGSFHEVAALQYFGKQTTLIPCATFSEVAKLATQPKHCHAGVMAIENSIAGSILPNYTLLQKHKLRIVGEVYLKINQHLLANNAVTLSDIREVHSHPMALLQCNEYLAKYPWKLIETTDTALSAKNIQQHKSKHMAAVGSALAAKLYNLQILAPNIQTAKNNYTRFLIIQKNAIFGSIPLANKASISFYTNHTKGSLAKVLTVIAAQGINVSKIQSLPIVGSKFKYCFYADLAFDALPTLHSTIQKMIPLTLSLVVYGVYKAGKI